MQRLIRSVCEGIWIKANLVENIDIAEKFHISNNEHPRTGQASRSHQ